MNARTLAIVACGILSMARGLEGQGPAKYRNFALGSDVATVSTQAGIRPTDARTIHQRPALLQDLEWRLSRWSARPSATSPDPVDQILFSFYNGQLFRLVVDYGHEQTRGMTRADMIEALSAVYGVPLPGPARTAARGASRLEVESGPPMARWGDSQHAIVLYQTASYGAAFRLVVTDVRLDDLARKAEAQALRLDVQEAPSREVARQKKEQDDIEAAAAKARAANKSVFKP